ncbi:uncharacterized protein C2845_PM12G27850 [Panicum miliaceum]|uniref:Uncharacterized protein n=1 Tax=Panicum miliaceum TaxID=4540 RepID=A0A3L6QEN0_PANMI|nr:uncharacterized protein C2845_PM12G27850 [Panicum miliaceum]
MSGGGGRRGWSLVDAIRSFPSTPESLMSQIDAAIASTEYARACAFLDLDPASASAFSQPQPQPQPTPEGQGDGGAASPPACYDARVADEAYRASMWRARRWGRGGRTPPCGRSGWRWRAARR